jgi:hypothetical protein
MNKALFIGLRHEVSHDFQPLSKWINQQKKQLFNYSSWDETLEHCKFARLPRCDLSLKVTRVHPERSSDESNAPT